MAKTFDMMFVRASACIVKYEKPYIAWMYGSWWIFHKQPYSMRIYWYAVDSISLRSLAA